MELQQIELINFSLDACDADQRSASDTKEMAMISSFLERTKNCDCANGYVLVNYPETIKQYRELVGRLQDTFFVPVTFEFDNEVLTR